MRFKEAESFILSKLKNELPHHLTYHNVSHTEDVTHSAEAIGREEGIECRQLTLLQTSALFHDSGFLFGPVKHEEMSCNIARAYLPGFDYTPEEIDTVCDIIMATKLPQSPNNLLGCIICDADLDYLGRDDFFVISDRLYTELSSTDTKLCKEEWDRKQIKFLENHHYFTGTSIRKREAKKQEHLNLLKNKTITPNEG